ncbi:MAG TPA: HAD family hydrolase, partial [Balneolaceae bacterium]|nr:HAD family hydrolase [Balneolaceae bacterium]
MDKSQLLERIRDLTSPIYPKHFKHQIDLKSLSDIRCVALDFYGTMFISGVGDIGVDEEQSTANKRYFIDAMQETGFPISSNGTLAKTGIQQFRQIIQHHIDQKKADGNTDYPEPNIITVWKEVLASLVELNFIEGPITEEQAIQLAVEFEFRSNTIWPVPELDVILNDILKKNCALGIISNSQFYTPLAFEALIGQSTDDFGFRPELQKWSYVNGVKKPSLQFYKTFTSELPALNLAPENVLYVGNDLFKDIIPAKQLNMKTALYVGDRRSVRHKNEDLTHPENQPDIMVDDLHQLAEC